MKSHSKKEQYATTDVSYGITLLQSLNMIYQNQNQQPTKLLEF
jgi:hypothetical protein